MSMTVNSDRWSACLVLLLLLIHGGILGYSATRHSPTLNEPAHLVAGLSHWKFGRFEIYRVNPPLTHFVAAMPVVLVGYEQEWGRFDDGPGSRQEFQMGKEFLRANGERSLWLVTLARWACSVFSISGGLFCFFWSRELWQSNLAGLISLTLWCFDPNILSHGGLVTPDCAAASFGLGASYLFWRWLRSPTWGRAFAAGCMLGLAELTKSIWIVLFGLWPLLWLIGVWSRQRMRRTAGGQIEVQVSTSRQIVQLAFLLLAALYVLNTGYGFDGTFTRLNEFQFVSTSLSGQDHSGMPGNRFSTTWVGNIPVPLPKQYLLGIDLQKKDFESYGQPSYLRGEWRHGGWWYYYIYGLAVKSTHGSQAVLLLAVIAFVVYQRRSWARADGSKGDRTVCLDAARSEIAVILVPAATVLVIVSSQMEFNQHLRYVLPVVGFAYTFAGINAWWFLPRVSFGEKGLEAPSNVAAIDSPHA